MDYIKYHIVTDSETAEILIAFLAELPFDTFEETKDGIDAFISLSLDTPEIELRLNDLNQLFSFSYHKKKISYQNWNQIWESNFKTILIDNFCGIRAEFHPPFKKVEHEIIINPKMAFGTGHHATTYMMLEMMKDIYFENKTLLDYGCGTGILAILAAKMNCTTIDAVDIEEPAYHNTIENATINNISSIKAYLGTLKNIPEKKYDIILANINRNVILSSLQSLHIKMSAGSILLSSGYLVQDKDIIEDALLNNGFLPLEWKQNENWIATKSVKRYTI